VPNRCRTLAVSVAAYVALSCPTQAGVAQAGIAHRTIAPLAHVALLRADRTSGRGIGVHRIGSIGTGLGLPPGARQGGGHWWMMRLRTRIRIRRVKRPSLIYVTGYTNGRACIQIKLDVPSSQRPRQRIHWEAYGLVDGVVGRSPRSPSFVVDARNYLQTRGVRGGQNRFGVGVEEFGGHAFILAKVSPQTVVASGYRPPARVAVNVESQRLRVVKRVLELPVALTNHGGLPARDIRLHAAFDSRVLSLIGFRPPHIAQLAPGATAYAVGRFRVLSDGVVSDIRIGEIDAVKSGMTTFSVRLPRRASAASVFSGGWGYVSVALIVGGLCLLAVRQQRLAS
jgi:hypothetical protein